MMDFVDFEEARKRLGKTDAELQDLIKKGELRAFRDGGTWKFRKEDIEAKAGGAAPAAKAPAEAGKEGGDTLMSIDADILFAEEEEVPADSAAETWIAADTEGVFPPGPPRAGGVEEAMAAPEAEPAPLALSPETDESSLGAVLSEEELGAGPMAEEAGIGLEAEAGVGAGIPTGLSATAVAPSRTRIITLVEPPAHHAQFTVMLVLAVIGVALAAYILMAALAGIPYGTSAAMAKFFVWLGGEEMVPLIVVVSAAVVIGVAALIGYYVDKGRAAREAARA
jgi:excisionase family DNA binding protein